MSASVPENGFRYKENAIDQIGFAERLFESNRIAALRRQEIMRYTPEYFANEYWREDIPGNTGNRGLSYADPTHRQRFELLWGGIDTISPDGTFLDVGCGTGLLVEEALNRGKSISGVDLSPSAVKEFQRRTDRRWPEAVVTSSVTALPLPDRSFDTVLCFDVLEHLIVFDIFVAVAELCRVARQRIVTSINLDNPYEYHPTILSRDSWVTLFEASGMAFLNPEATSALSNAVCPFRPEYDFFVFERTSPIR